MLNFGEDAKTLGTYIAVLATEYKMLEGNQESVDSIKRELYFAMNAVNRLDKEAESYFGGTASLNGFIIRDDVHADFLRNHYAHFNSGMTSPLIVDTLTSNYVWYKDNTQSNCTNEPLGQDDDVNMLTGLVLVNRILDDTDEYNGFNFVQESKDMINRIIGWLEEHHWRVWNPVKERYLCNGRGGWAKDYAFPFAKIACQANGYSSLSCPFMDFFASTSGVTLWESEGAGVPYWPCFNSVNCKSSWMDNALAALGNSGRELTWLPFNQLTVNDTRRWMSKAMIDREEYDPLLWGYLWGKNLDNLPLYGDPLSKFGNLLNDAPCSGPYYFTSTDLSLTPYNQNYASYDWSTTNRYRNGGKLGNNSNKADGEYNGLDYMLLFNLYYLYYSEEPSFLFNPPLYYDMIDIHTNDISSIFPYYYNNAWYGNSTHSAEIDAFRSITTKATIESDGNVTMRAGEVINMLPGFTTKPGAYFHAYIKPFHCTSNDDDGQYQRGSAPDSNAYGMDGAMPPGQNHFTPVNTPETTEAMMPQPKISKSELDSLKNAGLINQQQYEAMLQYVQPPNPSSNISVYPNPSHQIFNVTVSGNNVNLQNIRVFDALGRQINPKIEQTSDNSVRIDMSRYAKGIYLLRMGAAVKQLVLE